MVVEEVGAEVARILAELGSVLLWLQALGIVLVLWIVFQLITLYFHRKRMREIYKIKEDMKRIEGKIDRLLRK